MKRVRTGFRGEHRDQPGSAAMLHRIRIDLDTGFLNRLRVRGKIQDPLPDAAGDVETIDDVLIVVLALAICAGIDLLFRRKIVDSRGRTS